MIGITFAVISAVFFGLYLIPRKISNLSALQFSTLMAIGFSASSTLLYLIQIQLGNNEGLYDGDLLFAVIAGVLWATALVLLVTSIDMIGLSRSNQWKNLQGPVGVLLSLVILGEATTINPFLALVSGFAIFGSAVLFNIDGSGVKKRNQKGIILAAISGILFGTVALINKYVTDEAGVYSQQVYWSISILVSLVLYQLLSKKWSMKFISNKKQSLIGISSGLIYLGASLFMLLAFDRLEASIVFIIVQLNFIVVVLIGVLVFKEFKIKGNEMRVLAGFFLAILGVILLAFAR